MRQSGQGIILIKPFCEKWQPKQSAAIFSFVYFCDFHYKMKMAGHRERKSENSWFFMQNIRQKGDTLGCRLNSGFWRKKQHTKKIITKKIPGTLLTKNLRELCTQMVKIVKRSPDLWFQILRAEVVACCSLKKNCGRTIIVYWKITGCPRKNFLLGVGLLYCMHNISGHFSPTENFLYAR